ncbi:family 43 glycosylhydrolase [uncultured Hymenobacter sp.]|uniref:family 43 glycosylhydrolase n=1 Tax=uncultured Hymenobacter sp. TaxID=170016 RepID=UPI0035C9C3EF
MSYQNPILDEDFPDPSILRAPDGYFYAYATQTKRQGVVLNFQVARSANLIAWEHLGEALPAKPAWARAGQRFWAPHVVLREDTYFMYYSAQPDAPGAGLSLAAATSSSPAGPFVDVGRPLLPGTGFFNIDPMQFDDPATGRRWLFYGSGFGPIRVRELAPDRVSFRPESQETELVQPLPPADPSAYGHLIEASWVRHRPEVDGGWYYLFYSGDNCCGPDARYGLLVARARHALGPYQTLAQARGGCGLILEENERWLAPGHHALFTDDAGQDWLFYHAIDRRQPTFDAINDEQGYSRRVMLLDKMEYGADGWPRVAGGTPSVGAKEGPVLAG